MSAARTGVAGVAVPQQPRPRGGDHAAMTAELLHQRAPVDALGAVSHPQWCDPAYCLHLTGGDERPMFAHCAIPQQWKAGDAWLRLELNEIEEPGEPGDGPVLYLSLRLPPGSGSCDPAILTVPEATDLIRRLQGLVALAQDGWCTE